MVICPSCKKEFTRKNNLKQHWVFLVNRGDEKHAEDTRKILDIVDKRD